MKKLILSLIALFATSVILAEEPQTKETTMVFTARNQVGIKFYSQPVEKDAAQNTLSMSWEKFKKKVQKAWYQDEEGNWKEIDIDKLTSIKNIKTIDKLPDIEDLDKLQWTTNLELSTHAETKTLSKPASF